MASASGCSEGTDDGKLYVAAGQIMSNTDLSAGCTCRNSHTTPCALECGARANLEGMARETPVPVFAAVCAAECTLQRTPRAFGVVLDQLLTDLGEYIRGNPAVGSQIAKYLHLCIAGQNPIVRWRHIHAIVNLSDLPRPRTPLEWTVAQCYIAKAEIPAPAGGVIALLEASVDAAAYGERLWESEVQGYRSAAVTNRRAELVASIAVSVRCWQLAALKLHRDLECALERA